MTALDVRRVLYEHFALNQNWAFLSEVTSAPPEGKYRSARTARRIDVLLVRRSRVVDPRPKAIPSGSRRPPAPAGQDALLTVTEPAPPVDPNAGLRADDGGLERIAIEIKVSRQDFLNDVRNPEKQAPWCELADRIAYAVPAGLVRLDEVPRGFGLIEVRQVGERVGHEWWAKCKWVRTAPRTVTARPLPLPLVLDLAYRTGRAEARLSGYARREMGESDNDPEEMRAELTRLRKKVELLGNQVDRERDLRVKWQQRYAAHGNPPCRYCGKDLRPLHQRRSKWADSTPGGVYGWEWDHLSLEDHVMCHAIRTAAAMEKEEAARPSKRVRPLIGSEDYLYVPGPEPADPDTEPAKV